MKQKPRHTCTFDQFQAFVDGTLPQSQAREVETHIGSCAECREIADKLRSLESLAAQSEQIAAPDGFFDTFGSRVASRIAARKSVPERSRFRLPLWGLVPMAAAAGLVLVIALRPEPPAPHLIVHLPPATRIEPAAPAQATASADRGGDERGEPAVPGGLGQAAERSGPAKAVPGQDLAAQIKASGPTAAPAPTSAVAGTGARRDEKKAESSASDESAYAAKRAAPATELREQQVASPSPSISFAPVAAVEPAELGVPAAPSSGAAGTHRNKQRAPFRAGSAKDLPAQLAGGSSVRVIIIHLPGGGSYCPAPEIVTAIEIRLPPDSPSTN